MNPSDDEENENLEYLNPPPIDYAAAKSPPISSRRQEGKSAKNRLDRLT